MTQIPLVMTILGPDRPGLVQLVADRVAQHGGNWLESRMAHLGGQFAGILRIDVPAENQPALIAALQQLQTQGVTVVANPGAAAPPSQAHARLEIVANDRPGIIRQISQALATHRVNVEELHSERVSAPMSGEWLFKATANLSVPATCNRAALRADLEKIAHELMADIKWTDALQPRREPDR